MHVRLQLAFIRSGLAWTSTLPRLSVTFASQLAEAVTGSDLYCILVALLYLRTDHYVSALAIYKPGHYLPIFVAFI